MSPGEPHTLERREAVWGLWAFLALTVVGIVGAFALGVWRIGPGPSPRFLAAAGRGRPAAPLPERPLVLAGSGSNLPLTRALAHAFTARSGVPVVVVHQSIGSGGGVLAAHDGRVHLGLLSRPLAGAERRLGITTVPYARVAVVVAASPTVPEDGLASATLRAIFAGERTRWRDGTRIVVYQRERGDSSHAAAARVVTGFAAVDAAASRARRFPVLLSDAALQEALQTTAGAIGLLDLGAIVSQRLPLKALRLDGVAPSLETLTAGRYPLYKDLAFASAGAPRGIAADLIAFVRSPEGRAITRRNGYLPLPLGDAP